jgi:hypothetical protein
VTKDTGMRAIWFADPGVSSGVAWGIFNLKSKDTAVAMRTRLFSGSATITTETYDTDAIHEHARKLYTYWRAFKISAVRSHMMFPEQVVCGMEDFVLYPGRQHTPGIEGIFPAYIIGAFEGYRLAHFDRYPPSNKHYTPLVRQGASLMTRHNNQNTLKNGECWIRGREHERSAFSHIWAYLKANLL